MWWHLLRKKQKKFLTSNKKLGMIVELRKAEVRASRLVTLSCLALRMKSF